jgi:hypothetical protein
MFAAVCDRTGRRVLLDVNDVVSLESAEDGFRLRYRCLCGDLASTCLSRRHRPAA